MQTEKWLNNFIFDTGLIENSFLSETEIFCIKSYLLNKKSLLQISTEVDLTQERVRHVIENGIGKILFLAKGLIAKEFWLHKTLKEKEDLQNELTSLKTKFKKELAKEKQLTLTFEEADMPITNLILSIRAKKVLDGLNINTVNQLKNLSLKKLSSIDNVGVKTIDEIVRRAEEIGIKII